MASQHERNNVRQYCCNQPMYLTPKRMYITITCQAWYGLWHSHHHSEALGAPDLLCGLNWAWSVPTCLNAVQCCSYSLLALLEWRKEIPGRHGVMQLHRCGLLTILNQRHSPPSDAPIWRNAVQRNLHTHR